MTHSCRKKQQSGKLFDAELQSLWQEKDIEKKRLLALSICDSFKFEDKKEQIKQAVLSATSPERIDFLMTNACLSGEGLKVV